MPAFDLLEAVQPTGGCFVILGLKDGVGPRQRILATRKDADDAVADFGKRNYNVYFGVAKFETDASRTKDNVKALKSFWLDIDCGEAKARVNAKTGRPDGYLTQAAGLNALKEFCGLVGLPKPILVNSGRGVHVYWALTEDVTRAQWEPVAARLQKLCITHNFYIDPACFEVARVLRVPGTLNYKDDPPTEVTVLSTAPPIEFEAFAAIIGADTTPKKEPKKRELTALAQSLQDNNMSSFGKIMRRSANGKGCPQILDCYVHRAEISEPRWFDVLSVAKFCDDQDTAIHKVSEGYVGYDPDSTTDKIRHIVGPHTCDVFERNNPGGCEGCAFKGKIKSPIVLGREIREAEEETVVTIDPDPEDETAVAETYVIPKYPEPYFRGENGGIYRRALDDESEPLFVYAYDVYIVKRMLDPIEKNVVVIRYHSPLEGVKTFSISIKKVIQKDELRRELASEDVTCGDKQFYLLFDYFLRSMDNLRNTNTVQHMRTQFGWADNDSKFIVGDREITRDGVFHSPPSTSTAAIAANMQPVGTLEKWKEVFNLYGRPGLEGHAFAALTGFGAPLFKFLGQRGSVINLIHPSSGTGKTTILKMCNSIWGHPELLSATQDDKMLARVMKLGMHNNLPYCVDEMTNTKPEEFSDLLYGMTNGRGRDRMKGSANELRVNNTTWQTISLCSSNASFVEKLHSLKLNPQGELMRLMEYKIDYSNAIELMYAKDMFDHQLMENYGHAGDIYAQWMVNNKEQAVQDALAVQCKIDKELRLTQRERFWSSTVASNIAGGMQAKRLGLHDWDIARVYKFAMDMVNDLRHQVEPPATDIVSVIGDYINRHMQNIVVINDAADNRSVGSAVFPVVDPKGELLIRYEPDTKKMYLLASKFKNDCVKFQINYLETLRQLEAKGIYLGSDSKRLTKGMKVVSPPVHCLILDGGHPDFLNMGAMVGEQDAGGAS
jgi:hypothetical protein